MTRAEKQLYVSWARARRRYGGGPPEPSIPSRFLKEIPGSLVEKLNSGPVTEGIDLFADRYEVRESVKKTLYTGKTYNSIDNIAQFFSERGMPPPRGIATQPPGSQARGAVPGPVAPPAGFPASRPPQAGAVPPATAPKAAAKRKKPYSPGSSVRHPKYGRGTVLRREGEGDEAKLTVHFQGYGLKKIVQKYAGITTDE